MNNLKLIQTDQSGAEALIVAYLCKPGNFRNLFLYNVKPHVYVALHVFRAQFEQELSMSLAPHIASSIPDLKHMPRWAEVERMIKDSDKWPASRRYYFIAKMICHASNYGMGDNMFAENVLQKSEGKVVLSVTQAAQYLHTYHSLFPEIKLWHGDIHDELEASGGILRNLFGFPRLFSQAQSFANHHTLKQAYAFKPQSTVGCITLIAHSEIQSKLDSGEYSGFALMQNGHDSLLAHCKAALVTEVAKIMQSHINIELTSPRGEKFRMRSESTTGDNWKELEDIKYVA